MKKKPVPRYPNGIEEINNINCGTCENKKCTEKKDNITVCSAYVNDSKGYYHAK